ncbi:hypothetical protein ACQKO6_17820 [Pseudomonas monteilii]
MADKFAALQGAAHSGAFGAGSRATPTPEQLRAGNYSKGSTRLHGMTVTIETPMFQPRRGKTDGAPWSVVCMAHYGYINGTVGADGDAVDVFIGPMPESLQVFVVNQQDKTGAFDEHKVLLGFTDEEQARQAYLNSYEKGWTGLASLTACSIRQFKDWLKHGDLRRPLVPGDLIEDKAVSMTDVIVRWDDQRMPVGETLGDVIAKLRRHDSGGLMMDAVTLADLEEFMSDGAMLDAMVIQVQQFERKANQLLRVMQMVATQVKPEGVQISKAFKNRGTTQLAMLFTMDDGQSVSVFFHNPDTTPNKLSPTDEMVSWKWVLNKKDVTIVVAPERGQDLNPREVARRIIRLVDKNSAKFTQANANKAERDAQLAVLKEAESAKTDELAELDKQIEDLTAQLAARKSAPAPTTPPPAAAPAERNAWQEQFLEALAERMEISHDDADAVAMPQESLVDQLFAAGKTPAQAAAAVQAAATVEPETPQEEAMLAAHLAEREEERAERAANAALKAEQEDTGTIEAEGRDNTVKTAKGTKVLTGFKVIEAGKLVISHESDGTPNPDYPAEIQPRDRSRSTSQAWVQKTARSLDPDSLGRTQRADSGAPIVGPDRVVESGNGRAMAIREAYRIGSAGDYREWLVENAEYFGVDVEKINRMQNPVLVRVRKSDVDRVTFAVEANQDDKLAMTATEKARSDAKRLDTAMLAKLADGDLNSAANRDFVAAFLQSLGDAEAAQYLTTEGKPTSGLISRLQAALFAGAYSDDRLLEMTADVAKPEIANIVAALNSAAPDFMRAKEVDLVGAEEAGGRVTDSVELSLNQEAVNAIIGATNVLRQAKEAGLGLDEFLRQGDMFGGTDPAVAAMAVFIHQNNRSAKRMGTAFKAMAQFVESENARKQTAGLFGDAAVSFTDIVGAANRKLDQEYGEGLFAIDQGDMFAAPPAASAERQPSPPPEPDEDDKLKAAKEYLDSLIEGTTDLGSPAEVLARLEEIYAQWGEAELSGLFTEASDTLRKHALKVTADTM